MKFVKVKFKNQEKLYDFLDYEGCQPGDIVVVDTSFGFSLATVVAVCEGSHDPLVLERYKDVVCKVDIQSFKKRQEIKAKKTQLKQEMNARIAQLQKDAVYEMFAEKDETLKALLTEFKSLN